MKKRSAITMSNRIWDVVVIGGGPAGMMAAAQAASRGRSVLLIEKNPGLGKKLLITGGGRCNVTNNKRVVRIMLAAYGTAHKFLFSAFTQHAVFDTVAWFAARGVTLQEENEGRLFPESNTARTIWQTLVTELQQSKVTVRLRSRVQQITLGLSTHQFTIFLASGERVYANCCIVATGGTSHKETGSTGEGLTWLRALGHTVGADNYVLVPLTSNDQWIKNLAGVTLPMVKVTLYANNKKQSVHTGKVLFTHVGVSGPLILNLSKTVGDLLQHSEVTLKLDLVPQLDAGALKHDLQTRFTQTAHKKLKNVLGALVPAALVSPVLTLGHLDGEIPCHHVSTTKRKQLATLLKAVPLRITGQLGADKAVVSSGGVDPTEVNFKTMESRLVPGLYLVGDVLDINRPSGGYSLQLCWTTGYVAGLSV